MQHSDAPMAAITAAIMEPLLVVVELGSDISISPN
jgi:hypothetical protein